MNQKEKYNKRITNKQKNIISNSRHHKNTDTPKARKTVRENQREPTSTEYSRENKKKRKVSPK